MALPENKKIKYWEFKNIKSKKDTEAFKQVKESNLFEAFKYPDNKNLKAFKFFHDQERYKVVDMLNYKGLYDFKLIPENFTQKVFDDPTWNLLTEYDRVKHLKLFPSLDIINSSNNINTNKKVNKEFKSENQELPIYKIKIAKDYINESTRKEVEQKNILKDESSKRTIKELKTNSKNVFGKDIHGQIKKEEKKYNFKEKYDFKKDNFIKIGSNWNEKDIRIIQYLNEEILIEIINSKNDIYRDKNNKNKKYKFTKRVNYMKGNILYYYMNIIILLFIIYSVSSSYIELTIPGPGSSKIFYENKDNPNCPKIFPDEIHINNVRRDDKSSEYYFNDSVNFVRLIYNTNLQRINCMFHLCSNISKIDFSHFNTSRVNSMASLVHTCTSLTYINFSNFDTSRVNSMSNLFQNCISLKVLIYQIL